MKKIILTLALVALSVSLTGCILFEGYNPPVQQGNVLTQALVNRIHPGMTRGQVENILGSPVYTTTFSNNRMDYVYTYQRQSKRLHEQTVLINFSAGIVSNVQANLAPIAKKSRAWF